MENPPARLLPEDECYFAREYASGKKYDYSEANQLISNLKKPMSTKGTYQWNHKINAIEQFTRELVELFSTATVKFNIACIPSSKKHDNPDYDPRLEAVVQEAAKQLDKVTFAQPIVRNKTMKPAHLSGGNRPNVEQVANSLSWNGLEVPPKLLVLVDDVITAGTSYVACKKIIKQNAPSVRLVGVFWARTVWPDDDLGFDLF